MRSALQIPRNLSCLEERPKMTPTQSVLAEQGPRNKIISLVPLLRGKVDLMWNQNGYFLLFAEDKKYESFMSRMLKAMGAQIILKLTKKEEEKGKQRQKHF